MIYLLVAANGLWYFLYVKIRKSKFLHRISDCFFSPHYDSSHDRKDTSYTHFTSAMFNSAVRQSCFRLASSASRRKFSTAGVKIVKNENARKALFATAGISFVAAAAIQNREVSIIQLL